MGVKNTCIIHHQEPIPIIILLAINESVLSKLSIGLIDHSPYLNSNIKPTIHITSVWLIHAIFGDLDAFIHPPFALYFNFYGIKVVYCTISGYYKLSSLEIARTSNPRLIYFWLSANKFMATISNILSEF